MLQWNICSFNSRINERKWKSPEIQMTTEKKYCKKWDRMKCTKRKCNARRLEIQFQNIGENVPTSPLGCFVCVYCFAHFGWSFVRFLSRRLINMALHIFWTHWRLYVCTHFRAWRSTSNCHKWAFVIWYERTLTLLYCWYCLDKIVSGLAHFRLATGVDWFSEYSFFSLFGLFNQIGRCLYEHQVNYLVHVSTLRRFSMPMTLCNDVISSI